ncbi:MAG: flavin-containing monooxygenase [Aeoliella sp.]
MRSDRFCVIGAGSSGLAVAKNFAAAGLPFDCLEREETLGGNWCYGKPASSVYRSTHLISSKVLTEFTDFPMPEEYPEYPHQELVWQYLRNYADHFGLDEYIEYNTAVRHCSPAPKGGWNVELERGEVRHYRGLVIANGHNWDPRFPEFPGTFDGLALHSAEYKTPEVLQGQRVLVVGAGNSGCDIAVESAANAAATLHSMRRGYYYLPKFFGGFPIDAVGEFALRWRLPLWLRRLLARRSIRLVNGSPEQIGLPKPDHKLFETHPIINSQLAYHVGHGDIVVKPDVAELCGNRVRFTDGTTEPIDVILYATGFKISFPFIDLNELNWQGGRPELYLNVFHPERDDLFVAGMIQPDSGQWGLVDCQAQLIAAYIEGLSADKPACVTFQEQKSRGGASLNRGIRYVDSPRHLLEVEHFSYRKTLEKLVRNLRL